jgi:hypothetical protein
MGEIVTQTEDMGYTSVGHGCELVHKQVSRGEEVSRVVGHATALPPHVRLPQTRYPHVSNPHIRRALREYFALGDSWALTGLFVFTVTLTALIAIGVASIIAAHVSAQPATGPWPLDVRPALGELGVVTTGVYWAEEYLPSLEEVDAVISPLSEFSALRVSAPCEGCHLPLRAMYPSGDPVQAYHAVMDEHREDCDCVTCHLPPHPVLDDCSCCSCHGCWTTGWAVESHMSAGQCDVCHPLQ